MIVLSVIIGLFCVLLGVLIYLVCGQYKVKRKNSHEDLRLVEEQGTGVRNLCFDYNSYQERVRERERNEVAGYERQRQEVRNRSLADFNLQDLQHSTILIPPNIETNQNVVQDNTVSSTTNDNALESVNLRIFSFFRSFF